jgi:hypothetical protein
MQTRRGLACPASCAAREAVGGGLPVDSVAEKIVEGLERSGGEDARRTGRMSGWRGWATWVRSAPPGGGARGPAGAAGRPPGGGQASSTCATARVRACRGGRSLVEWRAGMGEGAWRRLAAVLSLAFLVVAAPAEATFRAGTAGCRSSRALGLVGVRTKWALEWRRLRTAKTADQQATVELDGRSRTVPSSVCGEVGCNRRRRPAGLVRSGARGVRQAAGGVRAILASSRSPRPTVRLSRRLGRRRDP